MDEQQQAPPELLTPSDLTSHTVEEMIILYGNQFGKNGVSDKDWLLQFAFALADGWDLVDGLSIQYLADRLLTCVFPADMRRVFENIYATLTPDEAEQGQIVQAPGSTPLPGTMPWDEWRATILKRRLIVCHTVEGVTTYSYLSHQQGNPNTRASAEHIERVRTMIVNLLCKLLRKFPNIIPADMFPKDVPNQEALIDFIMDRKNYLDDTFMSLTLSAMQGAVRCHEHTQFKNYITERQRVIESGGDLSEAEDNEEEDKHFSDSEWSGPHSPLSEGSSSKQPVPPQEEGGSNGGCKEVSVDHCVGCEEKGPSHCFWHGKPNPEPAQASKTGRGTKRAIQEVNPEHVQQEGRKRVPTNFYLNQQAAQRGRVAAATVYSGDRKTGKEVENNTKQNKNPPVDITTLGRQKRKARLIDTEEPTGTPGATQKKARVIIVDDKGPTGTPGASQQKPTTSKQRRCGNCGLFGHNARTCGGFATLGRAIAASKEKRGGELVTTED